MGSLQRDGFKVIKAPEILDEVHILREFILKNISDRIHRQINIPARWEEFILRYKYYESLHASIKNKENRIFTEQQAHYVKKSSICKIVAENIGNFMVSQEELSRYPEFTWRLVRPNEPSDIGPLHADRWFWEVNKAWGNIYPNNFKRTKVWIPIESEKDKNGLRILRYSHQDVCRYTYKVHCHKYKNKPVINLPPNDDELELIDIEPGSLLIFDDNLIHGGALNKGCYPRISLEFTCIQF